MVARRAVSGFFLSIAPVLVGASSPVFLGNDDIYFSFELAEQPLTGRSQSSMVHARTRLCGYQIRGNHRNSANPRREWDLNIDAIHTDAGWVPGVWADAFEVAEKQRTPRPPIIDLRFSIDKDEQPISARIMGVPAGNNAIRATLDPEPASRLFAALSENKRLVTIALTYKDNSSDLLQLRGYHDGTTRGKNSLFNDCLRGYIPISRGTRRVP